MKTFSTKNYTIKAPVEGDGIVKGYVSVYNTPDYEYDVIHHGAFAKSIKERNPVGLWCHKSDTPVARTVVIREVPAGDEDLPENIKQFGGLYIEAQFNLETQAGKEAYSNVKNGLFNEFSIGFFPTKARVNKDGGKDIYEGELLEWSVVLWGMNPHTMVTDVKELDLENTSPEQPVTKTEEVEQTPKFEHYLKGMSLHDACKRGLMSAFGSAADSLYYEMWEHIYYGEENALEDINNCIDEFSDVVKGVASILYPIISSMTDEEKEEKSKKEIPLVKEDALDTITNERMKSLRLQAINDEKTLEEKRTRLKKISDSLT